MTTTDLAARIAALMPRAQQDLTDLVAIPSVADPRQYRTTIDEVRRIGGDQQRPSAH